MKNVLYMLSLLALGTACSKSDPPADPGQLDKLLKVTMTNGDVIYVSPVDNSSVLVEWGPYTDITAVPNSQNKAAALMDFNGEANTVATVAQLGDNGGKTYPAKVCADLVAYGFDDWYLPAAGELNEIYQKLGPNGSNQITSGVFWSSSERNSDDAWVQYFDNTGQFAQDKDGNSKCRCARR